jgi:hypothetical protein
MLAAVTAIVFGVVRVVLRDFRDKNMAVWRKALNLRAHPRATMLATCRPQSPVFWQHLTLRGQELQLATRKRMECLASSLSQSIPSAQRLCSASSDNSVRLQPYEIVSYFNNLRFSFQNLRL